MREVFYGILIGFIALSGLSLVILRACQSNYVLVTAVIDDHTIRLANGTKVRYIGISPPQRGEPLCNGAFEANKKLVLGKRVRLEYDVQRTDQDGHTLAYVYSEDNTFINGELIENGWAKVMTVPPNVKYETYLLGLQWKARENQRGIWAIKVKEAPRPKSEQLKEEIVYITSVGKKYHQGGCPSLKKGKTPIAKQKAIKQGYTACRQCKP